MTGNSFLPEGRGEVLEPCGAKGAGSHSGQDAGLSLDLITGNITEVIFLFGWAIPFNIQASSHFVGCSKLIHLN